MAITYFGSAIWSYNLFSTGAILFTIVPAIIITSACLGVALATSNPNLAQSYFAAAVLIISIAQQLVPKTRGHNELDRAQLMTSSNLLTSMPPEGVGCTSPGNELPAGNAGLPSTAPGTKEESLFFVVSAISSFGF